MGIGVRTVATVSRGRDKDKTQLRGQQVLVSQTPAAWDRFKLDHTHFYLSVLHTNNRFWINELKASKSLGNGCFCPGVTMGPQDPGGLKALQPTMWRVELGQLTLERATKGNLSISSRVSSPELWCSWPLRMRAAVTVETPIPVWGQTAQTLRPSTQPSQAPRAL